MVDMDKGYVVRDFDGRGMLNIQKIPGDDRCKTDEEAVCRAMENGIKFIPVEELPKNFDMRRLCWIDTLKNREAIERYCSGLQQSFDVQTPNGVIRAVESPDKNNPGIVLLYIDNEGKEHASCSMQYLEEGENMDTQQGTVRGYGGTVCSVWGPDNPDGSPKLVLNME